MELDNHRNIISLLFFEFDFVLLPGSKNVLCMKVFFIASINNVLLRSSKDSASQKNGIRSLTVKLRIQVGFQKTRGQAPQEWGSFQQ